MAGLRDWIELDGVRYHVDEKTARKGPSKPYVPIVSTGDQSYTGGTPPFTAVGQRGWGGGFQRKYVQSGGDGAEHNGFRSSFNVDPQWGDRVLLSNSFSATVYDTTKTNFRVTKGPFGNVLFAYSTSSENIYYKNGSNAWAAVDTSGISWTTTDPTGFLSDCIGVIDGVPYMLIGSDKGHICKIAVSGGTPTATEVGRPAHGSNNLFNGIYCMAMYESALILGGQDDGGGAMVLSLISGSTANTLFEGKKINRGEYVRTMIRRYVDSDLRPDQLHFTVDNGGTNGSYATHYLYDGSVLRELRYFPDNYPVDVCEYDVVGAKGLLFTMARFGSMWRFTGDYSEVLRLDTPDEAYSSYLGGVVQFGKFIATTRLDATNGLSILLWDGKGWWQGPAAGSSYSGAPASHHSIGVYRDSLFIGHSASNAGKILELNSGANYATSGKLVTSLHDGGFRQTPKEWLKASAEHAPLLGDQTVTIEYLLDDNLYGTYADSFTATTYYDPDNSTGFWDTANGVVTVDGIGLRGYGAKIAGSTVVNKNIAYTGAHPDPTGLTPGSLIALFSEFSQTQYDGVETDDSSTADTDSSVGTLDQSQATEATPVSVTTSVFRAQTFQAGASAPLTAITVYGDADFGAHTVRCQLRTTSGGVPTSVVLATSDAKSSISTTPGEITFTFPSPYTIVSGTTYALVVYCTSGQIEVHRTASSAYANGAHYESSDAGSTWSVNSSDLYFKTYVSGVDGSACQLFQFDVSTEPVNDIEPTYIGYGSDSTGTANGGASLYIWNATGAVWELVGSNSAVAASTDLQKTIDGSYTADTSVYVDSNDKIHFLAISTYEGTLALSARLRSDLMQLDSAYSTSLRTVRSLDIDTVTTGNIATATLTATHATNGGTIAYYMSVDGGSSWESVTSGTPKVFAGSGNQLRWRADLTGVSSARPEISRILITYTLPAAYVTLVANSLGGSTVTEEFFPDAVYSKLLNLRFTLAGPGTTTPQLYSYTLEYKPSPDLKDSFAFDLILKLDHPFSDGAATESRTPQEQFDAFAALWNGRHKPTFTWIDGQSKAQVTLPNGFYTLAYGSNIPTDVDEEWEGHVPVILTTIKD